MYKVLFCFLKKEVGKSVLPFIRIVLPAEINVPEVHKWINTSVESISGLVACI